MLFVKGWFKKICKVLLVLYLFKALVDNYVAYLNTDCENVNFCKIFLPILKEALGIPSTYNITCCREITDISGAEDTFIDDRKRRNILQDGYTIQMWVKFTPDENIIHRATEFMFSQPLIKCVATFQTDSLVVEMHRKLRRGFSSFTAIASMSYSHKVHEMNSTIIEQVELHSVKWNTWNLVTISVDKIMRRLMFYMDGIQMKSFKSEGVMLKFNESYENSKQKSNVFNDISLTFRSNVRQEGLHVSVGTRHPLHYIYRQIKQKPYKFVGSFPVVIVLLLYPPNFWISTETVLSLNTAFYVANLKTRLVVICVSETKQSSGLFNHLKLLAEFHFVILCRCKINETQLFFANLKRVVWKNFKSNVNSVVLLDATLKATPYWLLTLLQTSEIKIGRVFYSQTIDGFNMKESSRCLLQRMFIQGELIIGIGIAAKSFSVPGGVKWNNDCLILNAVLIKNFSETKTGDLFFGYFSSQFYSHIFIITKGAVLVHSSTIIRDNFRYPGSSIESLWHLYDINYEQVFSINRTLHDNARRATPVGMIWNLENIPFCKPTFLKTIDNIVVLEQILFSEAIFGIYYDGFYETQCPEVDVHTVDTIRRLMILRGTKIDIVITDISDERNRKGETQVIYSGIARYQIVRFNASNCNVLMENRVAKIAQEVWLHSVDCIETVNKINPNANIIVFSDAHDKIKPRVQTIFNHTLNLHLFFDSSNDWKYVFQVSTKLCYLLLNPGNRIINVTIWFSKGISESYKRTSMAEYEIVQNCFVSLVELSRITQKIKFPAAANNIVIVFENSLDLVKQLFLIACRNLTYILPFAAYSSNSQNECCNPNNCFYYHFDLYFKEYLSVVATIEKALKLRYFQNAPQLDRKSYVQQLYRRFIEVIKIIKKSRKTQRTPASVKAGYIENYSSMNKNAIVGKTLKIAIVSNYPNRRCAHAERAVQMLQAFREWNNPNIVVKIFALANYAKENVAFQNTTGEVRWIIDRNSKRDIIIAGEIIIKENFDLVIFEFEFSLYGNDRRFGQYMASYLIDLLIMIKSTRTIMILHTVTANVNNQHKLVFKKIVEHSDYSTVMTPMQKVLLCSFPGVNCKKVFVIPIGTFDNKQIQSISTDAVAKKFNLYSRRPILLTFGFMDLHKGVENAVRCVNVLRQKYPDILYLVVGAPHPICGKRCVDYYLNLKNVVAKENLSSNVAFHSGYISSEELIALLKLSHVFISYFNIEYEGASSTLSAALKIKSLPIVTTPFSWGRFAMADYPKLVSKFNDDTSLFDVLLHTMTQHDFEYSPKVISIIEWKTLVCKLVETAKLPRFQNYFPDKCGLLKS